MSDGLQRQLEAFGATLESATGEPVRASDHGTEQPDRSHNRAWAMAGAAACVVAVVVGLVALTGRDAVAPAAQPSASAPAPTSTTVPSTNPNPAVAGAVPDDPLALERDGWTLVQRKTEPFVGGELPCEAAQGLTDFDGVASVHDIMTAPEGTGLDVDVQVLDVGSVERGNRLAEVLTLIGRCAAEAQGVTGETGAMSSVRASWFRAGPDFALVTIVGEGPRSLVLEIEGAPFDDDLIGELAHRADQFLRGAPVTGPSSVDGVTVTDESSTGSQQVGPESGQVKLWVSNQSFDDDPVAITVEIDGEVVVEDVFAVEGQHNWFSFMIDGLEPGEHTITAISDTGVDFAGTFTLPVDEARWMVLDYWYSPDDAEGRHFTFDVSEMPIVFS